MSYCVHCGVELDKTCTICPLCHTKVINPNQPADTVSPKPYPTGHGHIDPVKKSDTAILMAVILTVTAIVCGLLNLFIFTGTHWSRYVIGGCAVLWIFSLPLFFPSGLTVYRSLLLDGISIGLYFAIIAWLHPGNGWYFAIALPLIFLVTVLIAIFVFCLRHPRRSILSQAVVLFAETGILTISIELLTSRYLKHTLSLSWSAVALTCCIIIDAILITILLRSRLREEVRRRMHI